MANRRELLYGFLSTIVGLLVPRRAAAEGQTLSITITNDSNAGLTLSPNHDFVSENGDGLDIEIGQSGPGLEPEGKTVFEDFFTVTNPDDSGVLFGLQTASSQLGPGGPVSFEGAAGSLVVSVIENGNALDSNESVSVDLTVDFLNNAGTDIDETVTLLDDRASVDVSTGTVAADGEDAATLNGELLSFENAEEVDVWFTYGVVGNELPLQTSPTTLTEPGEFSAGVTGLTAGTTYQYQAVAAAGDVETTGSVEEVETDVGSGCFITTATVGESETLDSLRRFRDESMAATPVGRALVWVYYRISPPIAATLERYPESYTVRIGRRLVDRCGSLSDTQAQTDSRLWSAVIGTVLTALYALGVGIAIWGYTVIRLGEAIRNPS
jgi:subtilisin